MKTSLYRCKTCAWWTVNERLMKQHVKAHPQYSVQTVRGPVMAHPPR